MGSSQSNHFGRPDSYYAEKILQSVFADANYKFFDDILSTIDGPFESNACVNIWQWIVIYSPNINLKDMQQICQSLKLYGDKLPLITSFEYMYDPLYFGYYQLQNKLFAIKIVNYTPKDYLNIDTNAIVLAKRMKAYIFEKYKLDMQVIDTLIECLQMQNTKPLKISKISPMKNKPKKMKDEVANRIATCIVDKNFIQLEELLASNSNQLYKRNGVTIYHELPAVTLHYSLEDMKKICDLITIYCPKQNINKIADTHLNFGCVQKHSTLHTYMTNHSTVYNKELEMYENFDCYTQINKLKPITFAYAFKQIVCKYYKLNTDKIDLVIATLVNISNNESQVKHPNGMVEMM